jgi:hypothetical protein
VSSSSGLLKGDEFHADFFGAQGQLTQHTRCTWRACLLSSSFGRARKRESAHALRRFTDVDDISHNHANLRAMCAIAISVFPVPHSTLPHRSHRMFLRRDLRLRTDYFAAPFCRC